MGRRGLFCLCPAGAAFGLARGVAWALALFGSFAFAGLRAGKYQQFGISFFLLRYEARGGHDFDLIDILFRFYLSEYSIFREPAWMVYDLSHDIVAAGF